ncbi:MAG TPA: hypothetical protein VF530_13410 [Planctomycetota bacterium]
MPIVGGAEQRLNGDLELSSLDVAIDSGSRLVLFHSDTGSPDLARPFVAPLSGGLPPFPVARPHVDSDPASLQAAFRPGTRSVVYLAQQDEAGGTELYLLEFLAHAPHHRAR